MSDMKLPEYFVQMADYHDIDDPEDCKEIRSTNHAAAAEKFCHLHDAEGDYDIIGCHGRDVIIIVKDGAGIIKRFKIEAHTDIIYNPTEIKNGEA